MPRPPPLPLSRRFRTPSPSPARPTRGRGKPPRVLKQCRRTAHCKGHSVAVLARARRLAILIYRMLRYGQDNVMTGAAKPFGYQLIEHTGEHAAAAA